MKLAVLASAVALSAAHALAQPTAFSYQGRLKSGTQAANGLHDLRFRLFDAATNGNQVGQTQCADNIPVADGLFVTQIDFGQEFATPSPRFLEIEVRADTGLTCLNTTGFVVLTPRQPLTAAPIANHARSAFALDAADGSPTNAVIVDNNGNAGIGTSAPQAKLHVAGGTAIFDRPNGAIRVTKIANQLNADDLGIWNRSVGNNQPFAIADWNTGTKGIFLNTATGNLGVGVTDPYFRLTTVAGFPSDGVSVSGSAPNAPAFSLGASGHGTAYLGVATSHFDFSTDAAPGDMVLLALANRKLLLQNGFAASAIAIVGNNIGIGTTSPGAKLDVNGTTRTKVLEITGADLAEKFPASEKLEPGMVVAIDRANAGKLCLARGAYNPCVAGVVSGANNFSVGAVLGNLPGHEDAPAIALSGRVYVSCDAAAGSIQPGDLLTTSDTPGHAMKATDRDRSHGAVIGKAMTPLKEGKGLVLVLVNLQ